MQIKQHTNEHGSLIKLAFYDDEDKKVWRNLFNKWLDLKTGLEEIGARGPNLPEGISEMAFCLWSENTGKFISMKNKGKLAKSASFDTYNIKTNREEQIKACSIDSDLTSFGPKSAWDDLYFLDFYNKGNINGTFDIYRIDTDLIYKTKVNKNEAFTDQQGGKRRPRFSLKKLIADNLIEPIASGIVI